jgi:plastocyanin
VRAARPRSSDLARASAIVAALGAVALAFGACAGTSAGWTYAPQPSVTAAPAAPSGSAAPAASAAASGAPSPAGSPGGSAGSGQPGETTVQVKAQNIAFDTQQIQAPAGQPFNIEFDNQDQGTPHNIAIRDASGADVFKGTIVTGPQKTTYQVPALTAGTPYTFLCEVHPNMTGTVVVQ